MRRAFVLALVLLAAAFAGCASDASPAAEAAPAPEAGAGEGAAGTGDAAGSPPPEETPAEPEPVPLSFSESGRLEPGAQVCPPETETHCEEVGGAPFFSVGGWLEGPMTDVRATLTWSAANAATQSLRLVVGGCIGTEEDYECEHIASASGESPLEVTADGFASPWNYYFVLVTMPASPTEPHLRASPGQDVLVEGGLTWLRAPA